MKIKTLEECKKCKRYHGFSKEFPSCIRCEVADHNMVLISTLPSFDNEGFKNGEIIVSCNGD